MRFVVVVKCDGRRYRCLADDSSLFGLQLLGQHRDSVLRNGGSTRKNASKVDQNGQHMLQGLHFLLSLRICKWANVLPRLGIFLSFRFFFVVEKLQYVVRNHDGHRSQQCLSAHGSV